MADLKVVAEQLVNLTVKEVSELAKILKDEYGIEPAAAAPETLPMVSTPLNAMVWAIVAVAARPVDVLYENFLRTHVGAVVMSAVVAL